MSLSRPPSPTLPDESPCASAAISRENALNHLARASRKLSTTTLGLSLTLCCVARHCPLTNGHRFVSLRCVGPGGARGAWRVETWRDGRGDAPCCFSRYVRIVARTAFAVLNNLYCVPAYVVWMMALRLIRPLYAPLYWKIEGLMYHWLLAMVSLWSWTAGYQILESGDEPAACGTDRTLVLANHQSTADVPILMAAWNPRPGVLANLMWIMDRVFKFTNFGIVSVLHEDFFIQAGRAKRDASLNELRHHIINSYIPLDRQFMVLFPEGGFLHKRREVSQRFAEKNNLPKLEYVSLPRAGAMKVIMEEIGPDREPGPSTSNNAKKDGNFNQNNVAKYLKTSDHLQWVLDVTIAYPNRLPLHLQDVVCGIRPPCDIRLHYRIYPITEVPSDDEGMTQWLYDRFIEKDKLLEEYYRTGEFPTKGDTLPTVRPVRQDNLRYFILHSFFIASTYIQYRMFQAFLGILW